jgi:hypothetical protein
MTQQLRERRDWKSRENAGEASTFGGSTHTLVLLLLSQFL